MTKMVRALLNDLDETTYTDETLQTLLSVAAFQVNIQLTFNQTFTIDLDDETISPDPTVEGTKEDSFVNLVCLKAACICDHGSAVSAAANAVYVRDGSQWWDFREQWKAKQGLIAKGWCAVYDDAKLEYQMGQSRVAGAVVMTPFRLMATGYETDGWIYENNDDNQR